MIIDHMEGDAVVLIYGEWSDCGDMPEDAVSVQRDAGSAIVVRQRNREIVLNAAMARELARTLLRKARQVEAVA